MGKRIDINEAIVTLKSGGVVALPTETVYGLAVLATSAIDIDKVYRIKNRPADNPLVCHFYNIDMIERYTTPIPDYLRWLMEQLTPGPVSFLLPLNTTNGPNLFPATRGLNAVVCRIPEHWLTLSVIKQLDMPLAAPSANTSGKVSPTTAQMVLDDLGDKIDGIVDGGASFVGIESTIIDCTIEGALKILRPGSIGAEHIQELLNKHFPNITVSYQNDNTSVIPGNKYRHYAPDKEVISIDINQIDNFKISPKDLLIGFEEDLTSANQSSQKLNLGSTAQLEEVASNLYVNLTTIDKLHFDKAYYLIHHWQATDLEIALANRINKAFGLLT